MAEEKEPDPCKACGSVLQQGAKLCKECGSWQDHQCDACKQWLPFDAKRCNACSTYLVGWFKRIPISQNILALIIALVAVISPAVTVLMYVLDRPSYTRIKVSGADDKRIYVKVWNTGKQPSRLLGYHLRLGGQFPIPDVELDLTDKDSKEGKNVVSSASPATIALTPTNRDWLPRPDQPDGYTSEEFKPFEEREIALTIDVEESWGFPKWLRLPKSWNFSERSDEFPVRRLRAFLCGECRHANQ
jgi:hypothetical protein